MSAANTFDSDHYWSLWDEDNSLEGAFEWEVQGNNPENIIVTKVTRPFLFGYKPQTPKPNGRNILILAGGGYVELCLGREGIAVAKWLSSLGFHAFVLVHRFPHAGTSPQAPLDDARRALHIMQEQSAHAGDSRNAVCGLSSGGHLAAALLAAYPDCWTPRQPSIPPIEFAIIGYGPISTNAKGRTVVENKPPLPPAEKQAFYDVVQPDVQIVSPAPPVFIVYSGSDKVVPVLNAYRLAEGVGKAGGSVELHVFAEAPHGFALDSDRGLPVSKWPGMCEEWLRQRKFVE